MMNITCFSRAFSSSFFHIFSNAQAVIPFNQRPHFQASIKTSRSHSHVPIKASLSHLSLAKQAQLHKAVEIILGNLFARNTSKPITIILFGSYARGDNLPQSAFDLLVVTRHEMFAKKVERKQSLYHCLARELTTGVNLIAKDSQLVNAALQKGKYFYTDIRDEGVVLYDSLKGSLQGCSLQRSLKSSLDGSLQGVGDAALVQSVRKECCATKALLAADLLKKREQARNRKTVAQNDFMYWFDKAMTYKEYAHIAQLKGDMSEAAFFLHQSVEHFYNTVLLVFSRYKPRSHHLGKLSLLAASMAPSLVTVFSQRETADEVVFNGLQSRSMLELLNSAYVNARYSQSFTITQAQLSWLFARVVQLQSVVDGLCHERIASYEAILNN